jgi:putative phosphoribosyl transferase
VLHHAGMATLLVDLLDERESGDRSNAFDIKLLADRLKAAAHFVRENGETRDLPLGYFGIGTGAAAALLAASDQGTDVSAIVSCAARPDLVKDALPRVRAASLFIVGGRDERAIAANRDAMARMRCDKELKLIPSADHSYPEAALEEVGHAASEWFQAHFARDHRRRQESQGSALTEPLSSGV